VNNRADPGHAGSGEQRRPGRLRQDAALVRLGKFMTVPPFLVPFAIASPRVVPHAPLCASRQVGYVLATHGRPARLVGSSAPEPPHARLGVPAVRPTKGATDGG
jgi:hypothetical protein